MEELTTFDWEQRRYEIAKEILPVLLPLFFNVHCAQSVHRGSKSLAEQLAYKAAYYAENLINELKKQ